MRDTPKYSVVIPAYNQAALLLRLLESLEQVEGCEAMEVIVVDDCSTDGTPDTVARWIAKGLPFPAQCLRMPRNGGPGKARNAGLHAARGEAVLFTDTDCIVQPGWLRALTGALDPARKVAGAGGSVKPLSTRSIFARYNTVNATLEPTSYSPAPPMYLVTCNCAYLRAPLLAVGGFADDVLVPGGEDIAASLRLYHAGYRFVYVAEARIAHDYRESLRKFIRTWRNYGYGCAFITHTLLSRDELNPQRPPEGVDDWWVIHVYPTVSGLGTLLRDARLYWRLGRLRGSSVWALCSTYPLRPIERFAYYIGWLEGLAAAKIARPELNDWL